MVVCACLHVDTDGKPFGEPQIRRNNPLCTEANIASVQCNEPEYVVGLDCLYNAPKYVQYRLYRNLIAAAG